MRRGFLLLAAVAIAAALAGAAQQKTTATREEAYRANNIGVARLEQADFAAATAAFRRALSIDPSLAIARLNLGIALFNEANREQARAELEAARKALPERPHAAYMLGLIARAENRPEDAIEALTSVLKLDPLDPGANVNLGQVYLQQQRYAEALTLFRTASKAEPYNATAAYGFATALIRSGSPEGRAAMEHFQQLRQNGYATTFSNLYLEQGRYAEGIASTGAEPALVNEATPSVSFVDATGAMLPARASAETAGIALVDLDADGDLDLVTAGAPGLSILRNDGARFGTAQVSLPDSATQASAGVIAGDFDNDSRVDLLLLRPAGPKSEPAGLKGELAGLKSEPAGLKSRPTSALALLRQAAPNRFEDATAAAGLGSLPGTPRPAAWLDADHDGDLDVFVAASADGKTANRLFRNNGNGTFTDVTSESRLPSDRALAAAVPTDFDNRRDVDLLLVPSAGAPQLHRNHRDGSFADAAADVGLRVEGASAQAGLGDINKDDFPDVFFAQPDGPGVLALSDGRGHFRIEPAPPAAARATAAQFLDYDGDGLLDLFAITAQGPRVVRNLGTRWVDVTESAVSQPVRTVTGVTSFVSGDLDGDGDLDVLAHRSSGLAIWKNEGGDRGRALRVRLEARVSNRSALGSKVEMRAGSLRQRMETYSATPSPAPSDLLFGVGDRPGADVVRVLWPSGILQAEVAGADAPGGAIAGTLTVQELDRKPSSCPYLFNWTGERFEFVTDFLGGGEMGYWVAPGVRNSPDPDEYVRIPGDRLRPRDGRYDLRVTNELEEAVFLDRLQLVAVDHDSGVEVYPNEGLRAAPEPLRLFATRNARPPLAAIDDHGHDVLDRVLRVDRRSPDDFVLERTRGYAAEHSLTLTLPESPSGRRVLLLTGWTDYAFSGDNVAAHQAGLKMVPPFLQVQDPDGRWRTAVENIGFPAGRPQTVPVDLTDRIPRGARVVRIVTTMRIYWDQALVDVSDGAAETMLTRIDPAAAALRWRGFSAERTPDGREPFGYAYEQVSALSPWKVLPGRYTREGDVRELLTAVDDRFVVSRPGDEVAIEFDAAALPALPDGWTRTFLFYAVGFSKEMDLNSASPDTLGPLPFHGMPSYPFAPSDRRWTEAFQEYMERYNTRVVKRAVPPIDAIAAERGK
jgi:cytochrome c-type biogenesis protein CcmH/NrfG